MRELEIKAKVASKDALLRKLQKYSIALGEPVRQQDIVFAQVDGDPDQSKNNWLRIRKEGQNYTFTLKRAVTGELDNIEHETKITNPEELEKILELIGFKRHSEIDKTRQKGKIQDIEICIDEVARLGFFIEAELMVDDDADYTESYEKLWQLFDKIGVDRSDEIAKGYDVLVNENKIKL